MPLGRLLQIRGQIEEMSTTTHNAADALQYQHDEVKREEKSRVHV
jgi:hypothetical protein